MKLESATLNTREKGSSSSSTNWSPARGRGRGFSRGRERGRSARGRGGEHRSSVQCFHCKKFGHVRADCWERDKQPRTEKGASLVAKELEQESNNLFMASNTPEPTSSTLWLVDSGCSNHMTGERKLFTSIDESKKICVRLGNDKEMDVLGVGIVTLSMQDGEKRQLHGVQLVPRLAHNLLSVGQLLSKGYSVTFKGNSCIIMDDQTKEHIVSIPRTVNNMFPLDITKVGRLNLAVNKQSVSELWHRRFGHLNYRSLRFLVQKKLVYGMPELKHESHYESHCEECVMSKQARSSFPSVKPRRTTACLELVHMDLCGPMSVDPLGGSKYFLLIIDDYSRKCWVFFLKSKGEAFKNFKKFHMLVERQTGRKLMTLRSYRGGEFTSHVFRRYCEELGIRRELLAPYTPQQNGVVERKNRTVVEMGRCLLKSSGLPLQFWAEAVSISIYLINRSPTQALRCKTPYEVWHGKKPTVSHFKIFGCIAFALIPSHKHQKLDDKSEKHVFVGYCS